MDGRADTSHWTLLKRPPASALVARLCFVAACIGLMQQGCAPVMNDDAGVFVVEPVGSVAGWVGSPAGAPIWAPDGRSIAWSSEDGLFRREVAGAEPVLLSTVSIAGRPAWSPDARELAYIDRRREALVVVDAASGEERFSAPVLTDDAVFDPLALPTFGGPAWSPDGSRLAFNCWDGAGDEVCVIRKDGTDHRQVTHIETRATSTAGSDETFVSAAANAGPPAWSPDGTLLAVAAYPEQRGAAMGVFVVDLERGTARRVTSLLPNSEIAWFPDGKALLFSATEKGHSDALRASLAIDSVEKLTEGLSGGAREPALSLDGSRLAVVSGGALVVMNLEGAVESTVSSTQAIRFPAWSPDGAIVAYSASPNPLSRYS